MKEKLLNWAIEATNKFNKLSEKYKVGYYQQSPLNNLGANSKNKCVENLIIGFNPGSAGDASTLTPERFLGGNDDWKKHLEWKYFSNAHYFICGTKIEQPDGFDNDCKTVWTNLTPFGTKEKSNVEKEMLVESVPFLIELIAILKPKRIYLLGKDSFNCLQIYSKADIIRARIVRDKQEGGIIEIGSINNFPAIQLPHPSQGWGFHGIVMPIFVKMWHLCLDEKLSFADMTKKMREQLTRLESAE